MIRRAARVLAALLGLAAAGSTLAADPQRGAQLFATPPEPGLLACADCHGAEPQLNNFGNIWAGRNAVALIQRAVQSNTGGMGYIGRYYGSAELADIAAYLGNAPAALAFDTTELGRDSPPRSLSIATSTKVGIGALQLRTEGDFVLAGSNCGSSVPRFASCAVELVFRPSVAGQRSGSLMIAHDGTPTAVRIALAGQATARPAAIARLEPARLDFAVAGPPGVQSATLLNDSAERLRLGSIASSSAAFRVVGGSCRPGAVLEAGRRCQVALRFDAPGGGAAGATSVATLTIRHDGVGGRSTLTLSGPGGGSAPAWLQADLPVVDFGSVAVGAPSAAQTVFWRNAGTADWHWQATTVSAPGVSVLADGCRGAGRVAPGQACPVVLSFARQRAGGSSGRLVLQGSGAGPAAMLPVSGRAIDGGAEPAAAPAGTVVDGGGPVAALLQVDAALLDFGEQAVATALALPQRVTLFNAGTAPWRGVSITVTGEDAGAYSLAGPCVAGGQIEVGAHCFVDVSFIPSAAGVHQATLLLQGADGQAPASVSLIGRGVAAGLQSLQADTAWLQFAPLRPGGVAIQQVSVGNHGSAPAQPPRWAVDGPFRIGRVGAGCLAALLPGQRCTLELLFEPTAPGAVSGRLRFGGAHSVALRGEAIDAATPHLAWQAPAGGPLSAPSHGTAAVGGAPMASAFWTLLNRGDAAAAPLMLAVAGSHANDFSVDADSSCRAGVVLAPRQSCSLRIEFHPSAVGPRRAMLRVQGGAAFADLPLAGRGRAEARGLLQARPQALWFEAPAAAATGLFWHNDGPATLQVLSIGLRGDGFAQEAGGCPAPPFILQPGQRCVQEVAWNGGADARFGAALVARFDGAAPLAVPLTVLEDPALRSNVGGSGGGAFGPVWVLWLALAALALRRAESCHV